MKTKSLIELRKIDLDILKSLESEKLNIIGKRIFKGNLSSQAMNYYVNKYLRLGLIEKISHGKYELTESGHYFIKILEKLKNQSI